MIFQERCRRSSPLTVGLRYPSPSTLPRLLPGQAMDLAKALLGRVRSPDAAIASPPTRTVPGGMRPRVMIAWRRLPAAPDHRDEPTTGSTSPCRRDPRPAEELTRERSSCGSSRTLSASLPAMPTARRHVRRPRRRTALPASSTRTPAILYSRPIARPSPRLRRRTAAGAHRRPAARLARCRRLSAICRAAVGDRGLPRRLPPLSPSATGFRPSSMHEITAPRPRHSEAAAFRALTARGRPRRPFPVTKGCHQRRGGPSPHSGRRRRQLALKPRHAGWSARASAAVDPSASPPRMLSRLRPLFRGRRHHHTTPAHSPYPRRADGLPGPPTAPATRA